MDNITIHEAILRSMSDAVYVIGNDLRVYYANPPAERIIGYSIDDSVDLKCNEIFCRRLYLCDDVCPAIKAIIDNKGGIHGETMTWSQFGEKRHARISITPYYDGELSIGSVVVIKDISDLKAAEEKIRIQKEFLTSVLNALPHPFCVIDVNTFHLKHANNAALRGRPVGLLTCHELTHNRKSPCDGKSHPCPMKKIRETGQPCIVEHLHTYDDGSVIEVEIHGFPIFDKNGFVSEVIEYCVDISDRKRAADERETLIKDLQRALREVKELSGLLPLCSICKKIRDDNGYWNVLEQYISSRTDAEFSHSICPDCAGKLYPGVFNSDYGKTEREKK